VKFVVGRVDSAAKDVVFLNSIGWDDWFQYSTAYDVTYIDKEGISFKLGWTKIGQFGLKPARNHAEPRAGYRSPELKPSFTSVGNACFSLGQDPSYYETLTEISPQFRATFLRALNDLAFDPELMKRAKLEDVSRVSIFRDIPLETVEDQFTRLARGEARRTKFAFAFPLQRSEPVGKKLRVRVDPESLLPSNIHVIIGRNGVGKSTLLNSLASAMARRPADSPVTGESITEDVDRTRIANLVSVSFSAFDQFEPIPVPRDQTKSTPHQYVGLKKVGTKNDEGSGTKDPKALSAEMKRAARSCLQGARRPRWSRALELLENDDIFSAAGIRDLVESDQSEEGILEEIGSKYRLLSSGHKIVLLTVTRLVETVSEKSLVLLDEPEAHLHPPLLSAFVRALSDLLANRNGVALIATHSPVVLQEVPASCVSILGRVGEISTITRPKIETFGENVGTLTNEVFGLEVRGTGFHKILLEAATEHGDYDAALESIGGRVGTEGSAVLRALVNTLARGASNVES
jgi:predicted ATPase